MGFPKKTYSLLCGRDLSLGNPRAGSINVMVELPTFFLTAQEAQLKSVPSEEKDEAEEGLYMKGSERIPEGIALSRHVSV